MINDSLRKQYTATIGIECHVQLKTKTKLFAAIDNDARDAAPNTLVSHICFGLPGALPVLNSQAVYLACRAAFALDTIPQKFSKFDRKHYFYPDLPKGYQITQYDQPIITGGSIKIRLADGSEKNVGITRAHMEEDAGKSTHPAGVDYSLVDLNRAGTPLIEIVSEPDMHTPEEAKAYARELYLHVKYAGVSDANLFYGNMRFDVNVSVSKSEKLGTRSETKNLNSFRSVEKAVAYEIDRQIGLLEKGQVVVQETRGWDDAKQKTFSQRSKENADDYRYFPDPDLPPIVLDDDYIDSIRQEMPILPNEWRIRLSELGLDSAQIETLLEANVDDEGYAYLSQIESNLETPLYAKFLANWYVNVKVPLVRQKPSTISVSEQSEVERAIYKLLGDNKLNSTSAKQLYSDLVYIAVMPSDIEGYAKEHEYIQISDQGEILDIVQKAIADNPQAVNDIKNGEAKAIGFLVGQIMKESKGKANPQLAQTLIKQELNIED